MTVEQYLDSQIDNHPVFSGASELFKLEIKRMMCNALQWQLNELGSSIEKPKEVKSDSSGGASERGIELLRTASIAPDRQVD